MGVTTARTGIGHEFIDNDDKNIPIPSDIYKSRVTKERKRLEICPHGKEFYSFVFKQI